jgi:hypothetical protein
MLCYQTKAGIHDTSLQSSKCLPLLKGIRKIGMDRRNIEKINNERTDKKEAKKM